MRNPSGSLRSLSLFRSYSICRQCAHRVGSATSSRPWRTISTSASRYQTAAPTAGNRYFFANDRSDASHGSYAIQSVRRKDHGQIKERAQANATGEAIQDGQASPTHPTRATETISNPRPRRRDRLKRPSETTPADTPIAPPPLDASSALSALATTAPPLSLKRRLLAYLSLTKPRLATLIVLTTTASYSLYPVPSLLSTTATQTPSLSTLTLLFLTTGTFATVASANTLNMLFEPRFDAQMSRTRNRPLVRGLVSPRGAVVFAVAAALLGCGTLWYGVNGTTACLGAGNILLYAGVYTPLKRVSVLNTWVGAVVGAIPPLMGWAAAGGHYLTGPSAEAATGLRGLADEVAALLFSPQATGGWLLAALLFAWQFPHFNALSHPIRHEYKNAGYRMAVSFYPALNARVALRYSVAMFPICAGLTYAGVTDRGFVVSSSVANAWIVREAWRFWRSGGGEGQGAAKAARGLFWASVWHLPLVLVLAMVHKRGLWDSVWRGLAGEGDQDEEGWDEDDD